MNVDRIGVDLVFATVEAAEIDTNYALRVNLHKNEECPTGIKYSVDGVLKLKIAWVQSWFGGETIDLPFINFGEIPVTLVRDTAPRRVGGALDSIPVRVGKGDSLTTDLSSYIEDPDGGVLRLAASGKPSGWDITENGTTLTFAASENAADGQTIVTATDPADECWNFPAQLTATDCDDHCDIPETATPVGVPSTTAGIIDFVRPFNDRDVFRFVVSNPSVLTIRVNTDEGVDYLQNDVYRESIDGTWLIRYSEVLLEYVLSGYRFQGPVEAGTYYAAIRWPQYSYQPGNINYSLVIERVPVTRISVPYSGRSFRLDDPDDTDWFMFEIPGSAPRYLTISTGGRFLNHRIKSLYNSSGELVGRRVDDAWSRNLPATVNGGTYFISISHKSGEDWDFWEGAYTLTVTQRP